MPVGTQVSRCSGRIYDRNNESDIDITDNEDLYCIVNDDICNYSALHEMLERCTGADPEQYYDAHCKWLYGTAIERLKKMGIIVVWGDYAQDYVTLLDKDGEIKLSEILEWEPLIRVFNTEAEAVAYKMGLRDAYNEFHDAEDAVSMEFVDVSCLC